MEIRIALSVIMLGFVSLICNYQLKIPYANTDMILNYALSSSALMIVYSVFLRFFEAPPKVLLIINEKGSIFHRHIYFLIGGLFLGGYLGYCVSILQSAWQTMSSLKFSLYFLHTLTCCLTVLSIFLIESHKNLRKLFPLIYRSTDSINPQEFLLSLLASLIISDYTSSMLTIYISLFIYLYYNIYLLISISPTHFFIGLGFFIILNFLCNLYRVRYILPRLKKQQEEQSLPAIQP